VLGQWPRTAGYSVHPARVKKGAPCIDGSNDSRMSEQQRILIVGAGPAGLGAAWRLAALGHRSWRLVEAAESPGGLAASVVDAQGFTWDLGGHVVFSHYDTFDSVTRSLLGDAWVEHTRESWVWIRERFIPYPFQNNLWRLPADDLSACLKGLGAAQRAGQSAAPPVNFGEWIRQNFGAGLAEVFFLPYNRKVWTRDPSELNVEWMGERVATVDLERVRLNIARKEDDVAWGPNSRFAYPLRGGNGAIWRALFSRLPRDRTELGRQVVQISPREREVTFADGSTSEYDRLVSTMPLDCLLRMLDEVPGLGSKADAFQYASAHIVGIGLSGTPPEELASKNWVYFPEPEFPFHRVTVFSNYSPHNVPEPGKQWSLLCEVNERPDRVRPAEAVVDEVVSALREARFLTDSAAIITRWYRRLEHAYPIPFLGRDELLREVDPILRELGIWSRGRFGAWKYEVSNQDHAFMQGVEAIDHLLNGAEETTYCRPSFVNSSPRG